MSPQFLPDINNVFELVKKTSKFLKDNKKAQDTSKQKKIKEHKTK